MATSGGGNLQVEALGEPQMAAAPAPQSAWADYETVFTNAKAGMDGVDKDKVKQVVYEMSKGSRFFENETRKENATKERVERLKEKAAKITPEERAGFQKAADKKVVELESTRDLSRTWMHVDMDAFYASVEELHDPSLADKPMAVGGMGMICTANYEARKYGVRAAMPGFIGKRLCPQLVFAKPDFQKYTAASKEVQEVLREYDPNFIVRSLDEAYLDLTQVCLERNMTSAEIAEELRTKVHRKTRLTCSAGVAPNRLLAKVCSDINKPNGQFVLPNERAAVMSFITSLPTRKVTGIGKVAERVLREVLGITKCGELLERRAMIFALFSNIAFDYYMAVGLGIGGSEAPKEEHRKSLSTERTFNTISRDADLINKLHEIAASLAGDMAREGLHAKTLTLKLKTSRFEVRQRAATLPTFISTADEILPPALRLLRAEMPISIRLMGLRFSHFKEEIAFHSDPGQKTLTAFLKPAPEPSSPGRSSGPETVQNDREKAPEETTGFDNRGPDSATPNASASLSTSLEPGPSAQQRIADAHLKAAVATASFVNERRRRGGDELTGGEGGGREQGRGKRDGKIDQLLGRMRRGEENVEEVGCATCTFLNRGGSRTCRICGAELDGKTGASMKGAVSIETSAHLERSEVPVTTSIGALSESGELRDGGACDTADKQSGLEEASNGKDSQPGSRGESVEVHPSLRQWVDDYDRTQSTSVCQRLEEKDKMQFEDWIDDGKAGDGNEDIYESAPGGEASVWTDPDVQLGLDSDEEFDVVGSLREWSEAERRPASFGDGRKSGNGRDLVKRSGTHNLREDLEVGVVEGSGRELNGGGENWIDDGVGCKRLLKRDGSSGKASPGKRPRLAEGIPLSGTESENQKSGGTSVLFDSGKNGSNGINGSSANCTGALGKCQEGISEGAPSVGRPDSAEPGELSPTVNSGVDLDLGRKASAESNFAPRAVRRENPDAGSVPACTGRNPEHSCAHAQAEEAFGPNCKPVLEPGAKSEGPVEIYQPEPETSMEAERVKCELCGELVLGFGPQRQEHEDYHVALELYRKEGGRLQPVARSGGSQQHVGKRRPMAHKSGNHRDQRGSDVRPRGPLDTFLKKKG
ncbi:putative DNA repair protein [Klebsormidium nitens]|uniref:DNA polymerase kappa n=1 Tax=Klebsormidium nitens TaxID=105231 RepID=A0A1Y1HVM5_KLENI|nr:putative DNA repair protein [Klebsormidium nitens]|eukprot:GAQ82213.1 putative DNA repair protein [Klebsormidium nitens]